MYFCIQHANTVFTQPMHATVKNLGSVYRVVSVAHIYVEVMLKYHQVNKLYIISLFWCDTLDSKEEETKFNVISLLNLVHINFVWYMSHQSRLISYICWTNCYLFEMWYFIITPLYRCATQTTLNRLKQPWVASSCILWLLYMLDEYTFHCTSGSDSHFTPHF